MDQIEFILLDSPFHLDEPISYVAIIIDNKK